MDWSPGHSDDWNQRHYIPYVISAAVVPGGSLGPALHSSQRCCCHGTIIITYILFSLPGHSDDANSRRHLRHDIQCRIWIQLGTDSLALPARDLTPQHQIQGYQFVHCNQLGFQLARRRTYSSIAGIHQMAPVPRTRLFLCHEFCCW